MSSLYGITLERFQKGVGLEALIKHVKEFKSTEGNNFSFEEYDSLYDRRLNELIYALLFKYDNTLQFKLTDPIKMNGLKRIIHIGELEHIKDFEKMLEENEFLNRPENKVEEQKSTKMYRIYRDKNDTLRDNLKNMWNITVKKFCERWLDKFDEKTHSTNEFFTMLTNLKHLTGFEISHYEKFRTKQISDIRGEFIKFLTDYANKEINIESIILPYFKEKKDYSSIYLGDFVNIISDKIFSNLKQMLSKKFYLNEDDVKKKVLKSDVFNFTYIEKKKIVDLMKSVVRDKLAPLFEQNNYFALVIGDDIYLLNKRTFKLPMIYTAGDEDSLIITIKAEYQESYKNNFLDNHKKEFCLVRNPVNYTSKNLFDEIKIDDPYFCFTDFENIKNLKFVELDFNYYGASDLRRKGKISFLNLPQTDEEFYVNADNFLEVVKKLNKNFKYNVEEL